MAKRKISKLCSKCKLPLEPNRHGRYRYCKKCHAEYMRLTRPKYSELSDDQKMKSTARTLARIALKRGLIIKKPCKKCGAFDSHMHHHDYTRPTEVEWFCRRCHLIEHGHKPKKGTTYKYVGVY